MHRFFFPGSLEQLKVELTGDEANHLSRVLRLSEDDEVEVFDGKGSSAPAIVRSATKRTASLEITGPPTRRSETGRTIHLITAAPKSDRLRFLVEKATELGVDGLTLIKTQHSVVHPGEGKLGKLEAAVIAACKQSGRNDLMKIRGPMSFEDCLKEQKSPGQLLMAIPESEPLSVRMSQISESVPVAVIIGPEGGWSREEVELAVAHGAIPVGLGNNILRIETAAIAAVSALKFGTCDSR